MNEWDLPPFSPLEEVPSPITCLLIVSAFFFFLGGTVQITDSAWVNWEEKKPEVGKLLHTESGDKPGVLDEMQLCANGYEKIVLTLNSTGGRFFSGLFFLCLNFKTGPDWNTAEKRGFCPPGGTSGHWQDAGVVAENSHLASWWSHGLDPLPFPAKPVCHPCFDATGIQCDTVIYTYVSNWLTDWLAGWLDPDLQFSFNEDEWQPKKDAAQLFLKLDVETV